jgi:hypothetical protein
MGFNAMFDVGKLNCCSGRNNQKMKNNEIKKTLCKTHIHISHTTASVNNAGRKLELECVMHNRTRSTDSPSTGRDFLMCPYSPRIETQQQ